MSIIPGLKRQKQEQHSDSEDEALQKLVSAVLDSTDSRSSPRSRAPMVFPRLRRLKVAVARTLRRHPLLAIAVLAGGISLAVLKGRELVSEADADTDSIVTILAPGAGRPTGSAGAPTRVAPPSTGSTGSTRWTGSTTKAFQGGYDVAKGLIVRVTEGDYQRPEDVATGRFLRDFQNQWLLLSDVDKTQLLPVRRGKKWVQLEGPYRSSEDDDSHRVHLTDDPRKRRNTAEQAIMRMVKVKFDKDVATSEEVWKIEHIRPY